MAETSVRPPIPSGLRLRLAPICWLMGLSAFAVVFSWDLITNRRALLHPDFYTYYYSFRVWFYKILASGHFPLWNPNWGLGHPAEVWATIPLDPYTLLELAFGPHYGWFQAVQAAEILGSTFFVLSWFGIARPIAAATAILFFLSPWTNYFFFYFIVADSVIGYVVLFYLLVRWLQTDHWKFLFFIGWTTFLSMLGTKLEFWFYQTTVFCLLAIIGPFLAPSKSGRPPLQRMAWPIGAMMVGIAAQAWQLDILLRLMADSTRDLDHHWSALFKPALWFQFVASVRESAFLQLAVVGALLVAALRQRGKNRLLIGLVALGLLVIELSLPIPYGGASRDGGLRNLILNFLTSPICIAGLAAGLVNIIAMHDRDWRAQLETTVFYFAFVYYFCRAGHGDLSEVDLLRLSPIALQFAMGFMIWLGCRELRSNPVCRVAFVAILIVFLMRDQGQVLLAATIGWQWIPTRDGYIIEFGFVVLAAHGAARLAWVRERGFKRRFAWMGSFVALAAVGATLYSLRGDLYQTHPCPTDGPPTGPCGLLLVTKTPPGYPFFEGIRPLQTLLEELRESPTERFYFANDNFMEFYHFMGTSLLADIEEVTIYASLTSSRYREWSIFQNLGIRPDAHWRAYANDLTRGTVARLPPVNSLGYSNDAVYAATLISRPPPRGPLLELLGVSRAFRLYAGASSYAVEDTGAPTDPVVASLSPKRLRAISGDIPTPRPMFVADLNPLPRAFVFVPPSAMALDELKETMEARAADGRITTPSYSFPVTGSEIVEYKPTHVVIDANAQQDAVLVLSDLYHPFWQARIDGQAATIFPIFHIMRGIPLPAGRHRVEFVAHVPGLAEAAITTGLILSLSLGAFLWLTLETKSFRPMRFTFRGPVIWRMKGLFRDTPARVLVIEILVIGFFIHLAATAWTIHDRPTLMQDQSLTFDHWWYFYDRLRHGSFAQWNPYSLVGRIAVQWNYVPASILYLPLLLAEPRIEYFPLYNAFGTFFAYLGVYIAARLAGYGRLLPLLPVVLLAASGYRYWADFLHFASYLAFFPMAMALLFKMGNAETRPALRQWALFGLLIALAFSGLRLEKIFYATVFDSLALIVLAAVRSRRRGMLGAILVGGGVAITMGLAANAWQLAYLIASTTDNVRLSLGFDHRMLLDPLLIKWTIFSVLHQTATLPLLLNAGVWLCYRALGRHQQPTAWDWPTLLFASDAIAIILLNRLLAHTSIMTALLSSNVPYDDPQIRSIGPMLVAGTVALTCLITLSRRLTVSQNIAGVTAVFIGMSVATYSWQYWPLHVQRHFFFLQPSVSVFMAVGAVGLMQSKRSWILGVLFAYHFIAETLSLPMWQIAHMPWNAPRAALAEVAFQAILMLESAIFLARAVAVWAGNRIETWIRGLAGTWIGPIAVCPLAIIGALMFDRWVIPMTRISPAEIGSPETARIAPASDFPFAAAPPGAAGEFRNDWMVAAAHQSRLLCAAENPQRNTQQRIKVPDEIMNFDPQHPVFRFLPAYSGCLNTAPVYASEIPRGLSAIFSPGLDRKKNFDITPHPEASPLLSHLATLVLNRDGVQPSWYFSNLLASAHEGTDIVGRTLAAEQGTMSVRAFTVHRVAVFPDLHSEREGLKEHLERGGRLSDLLTTSDPDFHGGDAIVHPAPDHVEFTRDRPEQVVLHVDAAAPGYLALLDLWSPGWKADNNGKPVPIYRGYVGLRFVPIPAGSSTITFRYQVPGLRVAGGLSAVAWIGLIAGALWRPRKLNRLSIRQSSHE